MCKEQNEEYTNWLKQSIKEFVDSVEIKADLEILYRMARAGFLKSKSRKGGVQT